IFQISNWGRNNIQRACRLLMKALLYLHDRSLLSAYRGLIETFPFLSTVVPRVPAALLFLLSGIFQLTSLETDRARAYTSHLYHLYASSGDALSHSYNLYITYCRCILKYKRYVHVLP